MNRKLRVLLYAVGSERRRKAIEFYMRYMGMTYRMAVSAVASANRRARNTPIRGEKCGAKTRRGTPCQCKAMANGRCKLHGGKSTGPRTAEGKKRSAANLWRC